MTRLKVHAARLVILLASATILSACTYFHTEETIIPRPELLTAEEAGGGEQPPLAQMIFLPLLTAGPTAALTTLTLGGRVMVCNTLMAVAGSFLGF